MITLQNGFRKLKPWENHRKESDIDYDAILSHLISFSMSSHSFFVLNAFFVSRVLIFVGYLADKNKAVVNKKCIDIPALRILTCAACCSSKLFTSQKKKAL